MLDDIRPRPEPKAAREAQNTDIHLPPKPPESPAKQPSSDFDVVEQEDGFILSRGAPDPNKSKSTFWKLEWPHIWWRKASKKERIIGGVIIAVLVLAGGGGIYAIKKHYSHKPEPPTQAQAVEKPEPPKTTAPSKLTGVEIPLEIAKRPVIALQIENSPDARPQAGLKDAGVVFEAIAEGGITRFNAMFLEGQPDYIGPVRSIRPYYVDFFLPFDAALGHAGGSGDGLAKVAAENVKDLDYTKADAYRRVSDRYAPHNLYTSMADLDRVSKEKGYFNPVPDNVKSYPRKAEAPGQPTTAGHINFSISGPLYDAHYDYDPPSNTYKRSEGGKPHVDHRSGVQLSPKVVVALVMGFSQNGIYSIYQTNGSGTMFVFQDGQMQQGTWKKGGPRDQFEFIAADGKPLALNAGQTWFTLIKDPGAATFTP